MRRVVLALVATAVGLGLLLSYKAHTPGSTTSALATPNPGASAGTETDQGSGQGSGSGSTAGSNPTATAKANPVAGGVAKNGSFTGSPITSQFSTIQVEVTVFANKITGISLVQDSDDEEHSAQIDSYAIPILKSEALSAQSANIDSVSGATFTSESYTQSLQSALDQAGL
jgi:uncharacterized protein with FMN-binding domain